MGSKMKYICTIVGTDDEEEEITIKIEDTYITGFSNSGIYQKPGHQATVDVILNDDLNIFESNTNEVSIVRVDKSFRYSLYGILDIDNCMLRSAIVFEIDKEELFNYGYLDGKMVRVDVLRINFDFN